MEVRRLIKNRKRKRKLTTETLSEVHIKRDASDMTKHNVVSISLRSETESIDNLINKALQAVKNTESPHSKKIEQEWIK